MEKKAASITFRVTPEFERKMHAECEALRMELSEYIRQCIMLGRAAITKYPVLALIRLEDATPEK